MKISTWPTWVLLAIGICLVVLLIKVCSGNKTTSIDIRTLQAQHLRDSIAALQKEHAYQDTIAKIKQQIAVKNDSIKISSKRIDDLIAENKVLIQKRKNTNAPASNYPVDTSATLVPAEFINDSEDCFTNLEKTNQAIEGYKQQVEVVQALYIDQAKIDSAQIADLQAQKIKLNKDYNDMRMAAEANAKAFAPKRSLKFGLAGQLNSLFLPNGIGPGVMYEDRKGRTVDAKAIYGSLQPTYVISVHAPLFKF